MTQPIKGSRVLGIDPGIRTGTKCAALDETGKYLGYFKFFQVTDPEGTYKMINDAIDKYDIQVVAVGNGTGSQEVQAIVARTKFALHGEESFRKMETETAEAHSTGTGEIISCGGGVIKTAATMEALSRKGTDDWIDRDLDKLYSTSDRPLASNNDQLKTLYEQRRPLYRMYSDIIVENNGTVEDCIRTIMDKTGLKEKKL